MILTKNKSIILMSRSVKIVLSMPKNIKLLNRKNFKKKSEFFLVPPGKFLLQHGIPMPRKGPVDFGRFLNQPLKRVMTARDHLTQRERCQ